MFAAVQSSLQVVFTVTGRRMSVRVSCLQDGSLLNTGLHPARQRFVRFQFYILDHRQVHDAAVAPALIGVYVLAVVCLDPPSRLFGEFGDSVGPLAAGEIFVGF